MSMALLRRAFTLAAVLLLCPKGAPSANGLQLSRKTELFLRELRAEAAARRSANPPGELVQAEQFKENESSENSHLPSLDLFKNVFNSSKVDSVLAEHQSNDLSSLDAEAGSQASFVTHNSSYSDDDDDDDRRISYSAKSTGSRRVSQLSRKSTKAAFLGEKRCFRS